MYQKIILYLKLVRFNHTIFAMPFALLGVSVAYQHSPSSLTVEKFFYVIMCMIFARTAAMAFNRYLDREIDKLNPRTQDREIPSNKIKPKEALLLTILSATLFSLFSYLLSPLCFYLSPVALLIILGYSYTKRFTWLCHVVLGVGLALAPIGAYIAINGHIHGFVVWIGLAVLFWVSGFDIMYAVQDEAFDKSQNLFSVPAYFGKSNAIYLSRILHALSSIALLVPFYIYECGILYFLGWFIFTALLAYEHFLVSPKDISKIPFAFGVLNGWAGLLFGIFGSIDVWIK
ncbi:MAG: putative 4-hydroxybenzoate polyprenyltransferase [Bacteroidia bacterium]|nr:putative 4-hydroxybenzoate polyprenyltransferase [Bacteroidia bacterium]